MPQPIKAYLGSVPLFDYAPISSEYVRPADWLELPAAPADGMSALHAVFNTPTNFARVRFRTTNGAAYTVDWGDGVVETVASAVSAEHNYDWNNVSVATTTLGGYRQAIVTVTPPAGAGFDIALLHEKYAGVTGLQAYSTGWLDMNLNLPNLITGQRLMIGGPTVRHGLLERVNITSWGNINTAASMFYNCVALRDVNSFEWNMTNITSINSMFFGCTRLEVLDASSWDTSNVLDANSALRGCVSLLKVDCANWNTSKISNFFGFALADYALVEINVSNWDMSNVTTIQNMFNSCYSLRNLDIGGWVLTKLSNASAAFSGCQTIQDLGVAALDLPVVTNMSSMFENCYSLSTLGAMDVSSATSAGNLCNNCFSLKQASFVGINATTSFANCMLSATELNAIYTSLSANGTGKTITVTGNYGTASDDPSIATAKGWTVTG
jgi:surface protein